MIDRRIAFALSLLFTSQLGLGAEPGEPSTSGTIQIVQSFGPATAIVVNDQLFFLTPKTSIETENGLAGSAADLREGRPIRFTYGIDDRGGYYLVAVRLLSKTGKTSRSHSGFDTSGSKQ